MRVGQRTGLVTWPGLVISQAEVEAELRRRVTTPGGQIEWGREVAAADRDPHGVTVGFADGGRTTLYAELGNRWTLVLPARMASGEYAAVAAKRPGDDAMITLVADHDPDGAVMLVRPDAHLGWRGRADPGALDRWLTAVTRLGRAG